MYEVYVRDRDVCIHCSVKTSCLLISTCQSPMAAGLALDEIGRQVVQLFHNTNIGGFFFSCLWNAKINTTVVVSLDT
jgi:hypothetical protein